MPTRPKATILSILHDAGRNYYPIVIAQGLLGGTLLLDYYADTARLSDRSESDLPVNTGLLANLSYLTCQPDGVGEAAEITTVDYPTLAERHEACVNGSIKLIKALTQLLSLVRTDQFDETVHVSPGDLFQECHEGLDALSDTLHCCYWPAHEQADEASWQKFATDILKHASAIQSCLTILDGLAPEVAATVRARIAIAHSKNLMCLEPASSGG